MEAICNHQLLRFDCSGSGNGSYAQPSQDVIGEALRIVEPAKKLKASGKQTTSSRVLSTVNLPSEETFPSALVERDDELYHDPKYPPQTVQECIDVRNEVTSKRRTIYMVPSPEIADEVGFMTGWTSPQNPTVPKKRKAAARGASESHSDGSAIPHAPQVEDVAEYLRAFYHGLPVKVLKDHRLSFAQWDDGAKPQSKSKAKRQTVREIGLETGDESVRVRCRLAPDEMFNGQLNLNDILDVAMEILPTDAYALLMLVHHDLYEDEEDDFCCGRAYGGSRIAVVSSARYHPQLDSRQNVDREHSWPASHCRIKLGMLGRGDRPPPAADHLLSATYPGSAVAAGVDAFNALSAPTTTDESSALWLGRVCKTASHELGHCFGMDHCTYYACVMQGTVNVAEDSRQPPYLCPVDLAKVLRATNAKEGERYQELLNFCERSADDRMFAAFAAWLRVRLRQGDMV